MICFFKRPGGQSEFLGRMSWSDKRCCRIDSRTRRVFCDRGNAVVAPRGPGTFGPVSR